MLTTENLNKQCKNAGFSLQQAELDSLRVYLEMLLKWNKSMNLIGPATWREIVDTLFLDSFHLAGVLDKLPLPEKPEIWDFGAGAGLPGVPLRMIWKNGQYTMVEVREKRALFLQNVLSTCKLGAT